MTDIDRDKHPSWWDSEKHGSAWERAKETVRNDWEKFKHSFGHQAPHTLDWPDHEHAVRYGHAARSKYGPSAWNEDVEGKLKDDWSLLRVRHTWDEIKHHVQFGWESGKTPGPLG